MSKIFNFLKCLWPFPKITEKAADSFDFLGVFLIVMSSLFYIFPSLGYLLDLWGHLESLRPNSLIPYTVAPRLPRLISFWIILPWLGQGVFYLIMGRIIRKNLKKAPSDSQQQTLDIKDEARRKKRACVFVAFYVILTVLYYTFPQYIPRIPFLDSESKLDQLADHQVDEWKKENAPMQELESDHVEIKEMKISLERPIGWHLYAGESKNRYGIVIRKEATNANTKRLEDSPYMMILFMGSTAKRPPALMSEIVEKGLKEMFDGFQLEKKEIVMVGGFGAIRIEGAFEKDKKYKIVSHLIDLNGRSYWTYAVVEEGLSEDQKILENVLEHLRKL